MSRIFTAVVSGIQRHAQYAHVETEAAQQSADQSEKSCEDNLPVSSNISKPNSAPKRCDRIGSASVATCMGCGAHNKSFLLADEKVGQKLF